MKRIQDFKVHNIVWLNSTSYILNLHSKDKIESAEPGNFAELQVPDTPDVFLRRPISIYDIDASNNIVSYYIKAIGKGTNKLGKLLKGDTVNSIYPLGNSFSLVKGKRALIVGGGSGIAPFKLLAEKLNKVGSNVTFLFGGRSSEDIVLEKTFNALGDFNCTTEDGSKGEKGLVTQHSIFRTISNFDMVYTCGPDPMMKAVAKIADDHNIKCEVSLENMMACGIGACLCCITPTVRGNECVCTEGPVFNSKRSKMVKLDVDIAGVKLKNPVTTASGTFGFGEEFEDFIDLNKLGGIFVKGLTLHNREGNDYPRMAETASGMLNAVGLQNKGIDYFIESIYPRIKHWDTQIFPNINGSVVEDYIKVAEKLNDIEGIHGLELNISCPNVKEGGMAFGVSCPSAIAVTEAVREAYNKTIIVKLSPNVTDITEIAKGVEGAGADAVSLVNTFLGMAIDSNSRKPILSTITGGLSGPAIKPIALRMVWQVYNAVKIPVVGMGGIMNGNDAIEFMLAGASAIQIGTANFIDPAISTKVIDDIVNYCEANNINDINEIVGALITD